VPNIYCTDTFSNWNGAASTDILAEFNDAQGSQNLSTHNDIDHWVFE